MQFLAVWLSPGAQKIVRYLISGGTAAAINIIVLYVLTEIVGLWYLLSSILSFSVAWIASFGLHKFWTFRDHSMDRVHVQAPMHLTLTIFGLGLNTVLLYGLVEFFGVWYIAAQIVAGVVIAVINFVVYQKVIFRSK